MDFFLLFPVNPGISVGDKYILLLKVLLDGIAMNIFWQNYRKVYYYEIRKTAKL